MRAFKRESALRRDRDRGNKESLINVVHLGERWEDSRGPVVGEAMRHRRLCCCSLRLMRPKSALGTVTKVWSNGLSHFSFEWQTHRSNWLCRMAAHWQYLRIHYPRCVARRGCLSKLLTLQTCIHLAAVTLAIAIKKKSSLIGIYCLFFENKVSLFRFLKSGGYLNASGCPSPSRRGSGCGWRGARRFAGSWKAPEVTWVNLTSFRCSSSMQVGHTHPIIPHPLSTFIINNFHRQSEGSGSILHLLPQALTRASL